MSSPRRLVVQAAASGDCERLQPAQPPYLTAATHSPRGAAQAQRSAMLRWTRPLVLLCIAALLLLAAGARLPLPLAAAAQDDPPAATAAGVTATAPATASSDVTAQQPESLPVRIPPDGSAEGGGVGGAVAATATEAPLTASAPLAPQPADADADATLPPRPSEPLEARANDDAAATPTPPGSTATPVAEEPVAAASPLDPSDNEAAVAAAAADSLVTASQANSDESSTPPTEGATPVPADKSAQEDILARADPTGDGATAAPAADAASDAAAPAPSLSNDTVLVVDLNDSVTSSRSSGSASNGSVLVPIPAALSRLVNESSALNATVLAAVLANVSTAAVPVIVVAVPTAPTNPPITTTTSGAGNGAASSGGESKEDIPRLDAYKQTVLDMVAEKKGKKIKQKEEDDAAAAAVAAATAAGQVPTNSGGGNGGSGAPTPAPTEGSTAPPPPDAAHTPTPSAQSPAPATPVQAEPSHSLENAPVAAPPASDLPAPAEPSSTPAHTASSPPRPPVEADEIDHDRDRFNYAAFDAGAKMLATSPGMKKASAILVADDDRYLMVPCGAPHKSFVIQLSEDIIIDTIELANLEHYASSIREFEILGSATHPTTNWLLLGSFTAVDSAQKQVFTLPSREWVRFIKLRWTSHYGDEYYCTLTYLRVYGTTMLETFREEMQQSEVDVKEITREINNIKPLANKEDAATNNGNANAPGLNALPAPSPSSSSGSTGAASPPGSSDAKEGTAPATPQPIETQLPSQQEEADRTPGRTGDSPDGDKTAKPVVAPSTTDSAPSAPIAPSSTGTISTEPSPGSGGDVSAPSSSDAHASSSSSSTTPHSTSGAPSASSSSSGDSVPASTTKPTTEPTSTSQEDRAKLESELAKFTRRPLPVRLPVGDGDEHSDADDDAHTQDSYPSNTFSNKSALATLLHEVTMIDTVADVLVANDFASHSDGAATQTQTQTTDSSPATAPAHEGAVPAASFDTDTETSTAVQTASTPPPLPLSGQTHSSGSAPAGPAPSSDGATTSVSKDDPLPLPPVLKSSSGSGGSSGGGGGGQQSIFKALTNRIKELEIHQALVSNYVSDLADRYVKDTAALRARIDTMAHDMSAHATRNEAQWSEGWAMMNRTAEYVRADSHRVLAGVKEQLEEAQEFLALVESIIYLQLAVAIGTALAYFLGRWVLSIVGGLQRILCCMCNGRRKRMTRHAYSKSSPNLLLTAQQLQELRDERHERAPPASARRPSTKTQMQMQMHTLTQVQAQVLSPKRSPLQHQQHGADHRATRAPHARAASLAVVQQHPQQAGRHGPGPRHGHSASVYSPRLVGLNPRRASAAAGVSFLSPAPFDAPVAYPHWTELAGGGGGGGGVASHHHLHHPSYPYGPDSLLDECDDTDTQKNSSADVSEDNGDDRDHDHEVSNDTETDTEYERAETHEQMYFAQLIEQQQQQQQQQSKSARRRQQRRMSAMDRSASSSPAVSPVRNKQHARAATVDLAPASASASSRASRGAGSFLNLIGSIKSSLSPARASLNQSAPPGLPSATTAPALSSRRQSSATVTLPSASGAGAGAGGGGVARDRRAKTVPAPLMRSLLGGIVHGGINLLSGRRRSHASTALTEEEGESLLDGDHVGVALSSSASAPAPHAFPRSPSSPSSILRASPLQPLEPQDDDVAEEEQSAATTAAAADGLDAIEHAPAPVRPLSAAASAAVAMHMATPRRALRSPNQFDLLASPAQPSPDKQHHREGSSIAGGDKRGQTHTHAQRLKQR